MSRNREEEAVRYLGTTVFEFVFLLKTTTSNPKASERHAQKMAMLPNTRGR